MNKNNTPKIVLFNEHGPRVKVVYAQVTTKSS